MAKPHFLRVNYPQLLMTSLFRLLMPAFGSITCHNLPVLHTGTRYLFVSNHVSLLDTIVEFACFRLKHRYRFSPTHCMTAQSIYYSMGWPFFAWIGCFPTRRIGRHRSTAVEESIKYLNRGENVCIYPEGKRSQRGAYIHKGVAHIINRYDGDLRLVLMHIMWRLDGKKRHATVRFGVYDGDLIAEDIMKAIYEL